MSEAKQERTMPKNMFKEFTKLERKARRAIKATPEARALDRRAATVDRRLAAGKISNGLATCLKQVFRLRRQRLVSRWLYAFLRGEMPHTAK
jgi:hypothetical protein